MSKHRVPAQVQTAIQIAREADWTVSIRDGKVVITATDGTNLTIGLNPNEESLKKFLREVEKYNLINGPARTPAESEALLKQVEKEAERDAQEKNLQRQAYEAEQAKKKAEAKVAAQKAALATANGLKTEVRVPTQTTRATEGSGFPAFDKTLVGTTDYSKFQLADGRVYCIECLGEGIEFTARAPQGLATHRGFRHQMYTGHSAANTTTQETSRVTLPGDIQDAIDLLRSVVAENLGPVEDSAKVAQLEAALAEAKAQAEQDLKKADADYQSLKKTSDEALKAAKEKVHSLTQELTGKDGKQSAEMSALMKSFQELLRQIHGAINNQSPIQAVGKIDELVTPYLKG